MTAPVTPDTNGLMASTADIAPGATDIKLILSDIDGTLITKGQKTVSETCLAAFRDALGAGIRVGLASGRGMAYMTPVVHGDSACCATGLGSNGMQVFLDGELVYEAHVGAPELEVVRKAVAGIEGAGLICFDGARVLLIEGAREDLAASFPAYGEAAERVDALPDFPVVKANVFTRPDPEETRHVFDELVACVPALDFTLPMPGFINMTPAGWNKASAVELLAERIGIDLSQVVVFGDSGNDIEMLSRIPNSVAVANATPEAAAAARWHIGDVADDAVAHAIADIAHGNWPFAR